MIGRLRGEIIHKHPPQLLLEVAGVGYEIEAPMSTFYVLPEVGTQVTLLTHLAIRDDAHVLYGFAKATERELFRALLRVTGVGAKMGLAILSGMSVEEFARSVQTADTNALIRLPGVGRKMAERLVVELRDRMAQLSALGLRLDSSPIAVAAPVPETPATEAMSALLALGYKATEAERLMRQVDAPGLSSQDLIRAALRVAARS